MAMALGSLEALVWKETLLTAGSKQWAAVRTVRESISAPVHQYRVSLRVATTLGNWALRYSGLPIWASLMVMARAGWLNDSATAAVPPSRIVRSAIAPERL